MNKIALIGKSGSGKDYIANYLVNTYDFTRISFSDQLKKLAVKIYPWLKSDYPPLEKEQPLNLTLPSKEVITKTPREIWISLNSIRDIEDGIFIRMLKDEASRLKGCKLIISDIRTKNELQYCKDNNYTIIYIEPTKDIYTANDFDKELLTFKDKADYIFENDFSGIGSLEKLNQFLDKI